MAGIEHRLEGVTYCEEREAAQYYQAGAWIDRTVGQALRETARRVPDKLAFVSDERSIGFAELDELTERLGARLLEVGLRAMDRAIFQMGTSIETAIALLACYKAGIIPVCAVPQYREVEISQLARQARPRAYFVDPMVRGFDLAAFARQMMQRHPTLEQLVVANQLDALIGSMPMERARRVLHEARLGSQDVLSFQLSGGASRTSMKLWQPFHSPHHGQWRNQ